MAASVACALPVAAQNAAPKSFPKPLAEEPIPNVLTLPEKYPASWIMVHDFNFMALADGRGAVVDVADPVNPLKGMVSIAQFGNVLLPRTKAEIYTAETYYTRLSRGERTDVITIWDKANLKPKGEIILPGGKRHQQVTYKNTFQFTNGEKWALVSNFTPAQSVTVVDLEGRKVLSEIDLPGCSLIYPTGPRGFTTFCADSTFSTLQLAEDGKLASTTTSKPVLDLDKQPLFGMPAMVGQTAWFVSYYGVVKGFDLSGAVAKPVAKPFSVGAAEGGAPEWRPGGWQVIASDATGKLYVLMSPSGREGSHKDGGTEVWVLDPAKQVRVARIPLKGPAITIEVTREAKPRLVAARVDAVVDVYDAESGAFQHTLGNTVAFNPQTLSVID
ncbi:MAG: amine dehydrogenase [Sphingomonadales bacterium]|nr:amine dehydrogenase [Sphingomonadales bacterium]